MKKQTGSKPRLVFRRGNAIVSLALIVVIIASTVALAVIGSGIAAKRAALADDRAAAARLVQENEDLEQRIDNLGTADSVQQIAQEELGLEDPDTVVIKVEEAE